MRKGLNRAFEIWPVTPGCRTLEPVTVLPQFRPQSQNTVSRGRVREPLGCTKKEIRLLVFVVVLVVVVIRRSSRVMREHDNIRLQTYLRAGHILVHDTKMARQNSLEPAPDYSSTPEK